MQRDYNNECKDHQTKYNYLFDDKMKIYILRRLEDLIDTSKINTVLEVGCFEGSMTQLLVKRFSNLDVLEPSQDCIKKVQSDNPTVNFINTVLETYSTKKRYDLIIISHTLEHMSDHILALNKARELLSPHGYLYVIVPNATSISRLIACKLGVVKYPSEVTPSEAVHGHHITYDLPTLNYHCRESQLKTIHTGGIVLKIFGNKQYDEALAAQIIDDKFLDACYDLGKERPFDCASIFILAQQTNLK